MNPQKLILYIIKVRNFLVFLYILVFYKEFNNNSSTLFCYLHP